MADVPPDTDTRERTDAAQVDADNLPVDVTLSDLGTAEADHLVASDGTLTLSESQPDSGPEDIEVPPETPSEADLAAELLTNPEVILSKNGYITPPTGPGLGVELNTKALDKRPFQRYYQATR